MTEYDVVVIGAGPVGENVADYAQQGGLSVAVVEAELVGGECSYWACVPSKALLRPVHAVAAAVRVDGAKEAVTGRPDAEKTLARRDSFVHDYDDSSQVEWLEGADISLVRGAGRLAGERRVVVETAEAEVELTARQAVVLCTGSAASVPPIAGLREARPWTSREVTGMKHVPRRLAVIGGGVVACEMAAAVQGLGGQVAVLVRGDRLLARMEPFAGDAVRDGLREMGVDVRFGVEATRVTRDGPTGPVRLELNHGSSLDVDEVLVAVGRHPRTEGLGLDRVGLDPDQPLKTDDSMAVVGVDGGWLFAAGDVAGRVPLTHQGKYEARLLGDQLAARAHEEAVDLSPWGRHAPTADDRAVPQVVFSNPEVAAVGLTKAEADEQGLRTRHLTYALGDVSGAGLHADGYSGTAALLVDLDREVVVGATFVGPDVAELLHAATVAVVGEVPIDRLWHAVPAFPTMSEIWLRLLEEWRRG
jgi:pyruvate/2-oxoglutarate dehydrogenase complex dihydrolipoamide dehydrogenase (E3) component